MTKRVRTRFAPSPTGYLHIGGLRTALFAWLYARANDGDFVLRIEDTDQQREVQGAIDLIYSTMREAGLLYDEGPDVGGDYGPYIQSQRRNIYREYTDLLVERGGAYYCFCTKQDLENRRGQDDFKYDRECLKIPAEQAKARVLAGEPHVVRQRIPQAGQAGFKDLVFGDISVDMAELEDGILLKTDGLPTYNFANVVDDNLMGITHIIRGTEYLSSTPKYNLIYQAFGWDIPEYIHVSPVMKDEKRKLSKRYGDASYQDFIDKGYLKEAVLNYIALLGWNPGTNQEIFTLQQLVQAFDVNGISKSPAIFDEAKLKWMNAEYIKAMDEQGFTQAAEKYYVQALGQGEWDTNMLFRILQPRLDMFSEIPEKIAFLAKLPDFDIELFTHKKMKTNPELALEIIKYAYQVFSGIQWSEESIHKAIIDLAESKALKNGQIFWSVRIALTGTQVTPGGAVEAAVLLGKQQSLERMQKAIKKLESKLA